MQVERDALITDNRRLVRAVARQVGEGLATPAPMEDLVEYGMVGLVEAADRYDPSRGVPFSSFAWPRVRGAVYDGLRKMRGLSRTELNRLRFERAAAALLAEAASSDQPPGATVEDEFANAAGLVADVGVSYLVSCETSELPDPRPNTERLVADSELTHLLNAGLDRLPEKERSLLRLYYFGELTLEQAGEELGMSRSWAWRLHNRGLAMLREALTGSA